MNCEVDIICDRCGKTVHGITDDSSEVGMTGGFYDMVGWKDFARENEKNVCDSCMWDDPKYIAIYGRHQ